MKEGMGGRDRVETTSECGVETEERAESRHGEERRGGANNNCEKKKSWTRGEPAGQ